MAFYVVYNFKRNKTPKPNAMCACVAPTLMMRSQESELEFQWDQPHLIQN